MQCDQKLSHFPQFSTQLPNENDKSKQKRASPSYTLPAMTQNKCLYYTKHIRTPHTDIEGSLISSLERRHGLALGLVERVHRYGPVAQVHLLMRLLLPRERVLHPFVVVAVGEVLACVRSSRFLAVGCCFGGLDPVIMMLAREWVS